MSEHSTFSVVKSETATQIPLTVNLDEDLKDIYLAKAEAEGKDLDTVINQGLRRAVRNERGDKYGLSDEEIANIARNDNDARFLIFHRSILRGVAEHAEFFPTLPPCAPFITDLEEMYDDFADACKQSNLSQEQLKKAREAEQASMEKRMKKINSVAEYHKKLYDLGLLPQEMGTPPVMEPILRPPSAPLSLRAENAPDAHIQLTWEPPVGGGRVLSYLVERVKVPCDNGIPWALAVTSLSTKVLLPETLGDVLLYRVIAVGADGRGEPSNDVIIEVE